MTHLHNIPSRNRRTGSAYIFVLGVAMLMSILGFSLLTSVQSAGRTTSQTNDVIAASALAESAVSYALCTLAKDPNWRLKYVSGVETSQLSLGSGTISFKLVDETDGNLLNDASQPVRLYAYGRYGQAGRCYSVQLTPGGPALDVLKTVCHSALTLSTSGTVAGAGGPYSANTTLTVGAGATVNGNVEAPVVTNLGSVAGSIQTVAIKTMPSSSVFDQYLPQATTIPWASITSGIFQNQLLSPSNNPYGTPNAKGIYYIHVPSSGTLTITQSRIVATLLVDIDAGGQLKTSGSFRMESPSNAQPALIVRAAGLATVSLGGSATALSESTTGVNFNPAGTPYPLNGGTTNTDTLDTYPSELVGVVHIIGTAFTTNLNSNLTTKGVIITEGPLAVSGNIDLHADPTLFTLPPTGYTAAGQMLPVSGTWRWETMP